MLGMRSARARTGRRGAGAGRANGAAAEDAPPWLKLLVLDAAESGDGLIPLLLPRDEVIRIFEIRSFMPIRTYSRFAVVEEDGIWISEPRPLSPG